MDGPNQLHEPQVPSTTCDKTNIACALHAKYGQSSGNAQTDLHNLPYAANHFDLGVQTIRKARRMPPTARSTPFGAAYRMRVSSGMTSCAVALPRTTEVHSPRAGMGLARAAGSCQTTLSPSAASVSQARRLPRSPRNLVRDNMQHASCNIPRIVPMLPVRGNPIHR